jgi:hypothetical protein
MNSAALPDFNLRYRQETTQPLFRVVRAGDSCSIVGASGMAKSNLFRHLLKPEVREHYLGEAWRSYLFVAIDSHELGELSEQAMYNLLLARLAAEVQDGARDEGTASRIRTAHEQVAKAADASAWHGAFAQAVAAIMDSDPPRRLVFLFDQFDEVYTTLNARFFANLRAIRDQLKYRVSYIAFTRDVLPCLCHKPECEEFYELLSPNVIGLGPYNRDDSWNLLHRIAGRYGTKPDPALGDRLIALSAGHPGLLKATYMATLRGNLSLPESDTEAIQVLLAEPDVKTEGRKLWQSLGEDEQRALSTIGVGLQTPEGWRDVLDLLELKALVTHGSDGGLSVVCPIFGAFIVALAPSRALDIVVDKVSGQAWVAGKSIGESLTRLEFDLLAYLYERRGDVCARDEIMSILYPEDVKNPDAEIADSRVDTIVGRLRGKIEPDRSRPKYILTVHGRGYKLCEVGRE